MKDHEKRQSIRPVGAGKLEMDMHDHCAELLISVSMSYISSEALKNVGNILAFVILLIFIAIGIVFDIVGMAATSATEKEFHSMAAKKFPVQRKLCGCPVMPVRFQVFATMWLGIFRVLFQAPLVRL